jgi:FkbM family methyltransferase
MLSRYLTKIAFHLNFILNHQRRWRLFLGYLLLFTRLNRFIKIKKNGYRIYFTKNVLALNNFVDNKSRSEEEFIFKKLLKKNDVYVDVGANIGTLCICASSCKEGIKVYGIEANPKTFKNLKANLSLNSIKNAELFNIALGEKNGKIEFENRGTDDQNSVISSRSNKSKIVSIEIRRFDDVMVLPHISLLKIDVEGYELFVLKGMEKNLNNCDLIYFEYSPNNTLKYDYDAIKIIKYLESKAFSIYEPKIDNQSLKYEKFNASNTKNDLNLIAVKNSLAVNNIIVE